MVLDHNNAPVATDSAAAPFTTEAFRAADFVSGPLALDRGHYVGTLENAVITLTDALLNTDADSMEHVYLQVGGTRDSKGFALRLTETGPDTGVFQGSLGFNLLQSKPGLHQLLVADHPDPGGL